MINLEEMKHEVHELCKAKKFDTKPKEHCESYDEYYLMVCEKVSRLHSEVSEYFDAVKKGLPKEHVHEEVVDILFLLLNVALIEGVDLEQEFLRKLGMNWDRPEHYGTYRLEETS